MHLGGVFFCILTCLLRCAVGVISFIFDTSTIVVTDNMINSNKWCVNVETVIIIIFSGVMPRCGPYGIEVPTWDLNGSRQLFMGLLGRVFTPKFIDTIRKRRQAVGSPRR